LVKALSAGARDIDWFSDYQVRCFVFYCCYVVSANSMIMPVPTLYTRSANAFARIPDSKISECDTVGN
tara:strand:- start:156 stop:359 length:204 start_codon:yes stop_codon:yes gene_type:complete